MPDVAEPLTLLLYVRELVDPDVFSRGLLLLERRDVLRVSGSDLSMTGIVLDDEPRDVDLKLFPVGEAALRAEPRCSCGVLAGQWCSHAVAMTVCAVRRGHQDRLWWSQLAGLAERSKYAWMRECFLALPVEHRQKVYRALAVATHPDRNDGDQVPFQMLQDAWAAAD